jgi:hypothetical protein
VGAVLVDQRDVCHAALAQRIAEVRGQLQAAGAAADDDDSVLWTKGCSGTIKGLICFRCQN